MNRRRWISGFATFVISATAAFLLSQTFDFDILAASTRLRAQPGQEQAAALPEPPIVTEVPDVVSSVQSIEVVSAELVNGGTPDADLQLVLRNIGDTTISQVNFSLGLNTDYWRERTGEQNEPLSLLAPGEVLTIAIPAANVEPTGIVVVSAALFVDNTYQGSSDAIEKIVERRTKFPRPVLPASAPESAPSSPGEME